jgi:hypothetical protein
MSQRYKLRSAKLQERNDPSRVAGEAGGGKDQECGGSGEPPSKMCKTLPKPVEGAARSLGQLVKAGPLLAITDLPQVW